MTIEELFLILKPMSAERFFIILWVILIVKDLLYSSYSIVFDRLFPPKIVQDIRTINGALEGLRTKINKLEQEISKC